MIEAIKYFSNSTYFQTCEISNETVWKLAVYNKNNVCKTSKAYMIEIDNGEDDSKLDIEAMNDKATELKRLEELSFD